MKPSTVWGRVEASCLLLIAIGICAPRDARADFERGALTLFLAADPPGGATVDGGISNAMEWWGATDLPFQSRGSGAILPVDGARIKLKRFGPDNQLSVLLENMPNRTRGNVATSIGFARQPGGTSLPLGFSRHDRLLTVTTSPVSLAFSARMFVRDFAAGTWVASGALVPGTCAVGAAATPVSLVEHGVTIACRTPGGASDFFTLELRTSDAGSCQHLPSAVGPRLVDGCSDCARAVCAVDPFCCNNSWDGICVNRALGMGGFAPHCTGGSSGSPSVLRDPFPTESRVFVTQELGATVLGTYPYMPAEGIRLGTTGLGSRNLVQTWKRITTSGRQRELKVLTWNIKRFTDSASGMEAALTLPENDFFPDSLVTACAIGRRIGDTGATIVALEEAWDPKELVTVRSCANARRAELGLPPFVDWTASGEGVSNLFNPADLPSGSDPLLEYVISPGGVVIMSVFDILFSSIHPFDNCKADDCLAQKGVVHARINLGSLPDDPPAAGDPASHDNGRYSPSGDEFIDVFAAHMNSAGDFTTCQHHPVEIKDTMLEVVAPALEVALSFIPVPPIEDLITYAVYQVAQRGCSPPADGDIFPDMSFVPESLTAAGVIAAQHAEARDFILSTIAGDRDRPALFLGDFNTDEGFPTDTAPGTLHRAMSDAYATAPPGVTPLSAVSPFDLVFPFDIDVFEISMNPPGDILPIKSRSCTGAPGAPACPDLFLWPFPPTAANAGTDFSKPISASDDCGASGAPPSSGGGKLDYITFIKPLASPKFVMMPKPDSTGHFVFRRMDIDPSGVRCMSDHYGMEATFRWFRNFESPALDTRRLTTWELQVGHASTQESDGFLAHIDFFGNFFGVDSTAGSITCGADHHGPGAGFSFFPNHDREILDMPPGWSSTFTRPGGTAPTNDWRTALQISDHDTASANDAFDCSHNVPGVWETNSAMRFGFHQVLGGEAQILAVHNGADLAGVGPQQFVLRADAPYSIEDTGSERMCDAAGGFATIRWLATPSN